jgi:hypothetical protein
MRHAAVLGIVLLVAASVAVAVVVRRWPAADDNGGREPIAEPRGDAAKTTSARSRTELPRTRDLERHVVRGTVKEWNDKPIADAEVVLLRTDPSGREFAGSPIVQFDEPVASVTTDADGEFQLATESKARLVVCARKAGFAPSAVVVKDDEAIQFVLFAGAPREFIVLDEDSKPVVGAQVSLSNDHDLVRAAALTDAGGRARLIAEDQGFVVVRANGLATSKEKFHFEGSPAEPARIVVREGRSMAGVVVDGAGEALEGVLVKVEHRDGMIVAVRTSADGRFSFDGLGSRVDVDGWNVSAWVEGRALDGVSAVPGDLDIHLVLRRPPTVRGIVVYENGTPAARAYVGWRRNTRCMTDDGGRFELTDEPPGVWELTAYARALDDARVMFEGSATITAPEGGVLSGVRITVGPAKAVSYVVVQVSDTARGPVQYANVVAWLGPVQVADGRTLKDGTCLIAAENVPAGSRVAVTASRDFDAARRGDEPTLRTACTAQPVVTRSAPPIDTIELTLGPPARLRIRLVDESEHTVPLAPRIGIGRLHVLDDGSVELPVDLTETSIEVAGYANQVIRLTPPNVGAIERTVRLLRACRVVGRLGDAVDGRTVRLDVTSTEGDICRATTVADSGNFEFHDVPPGRARLSNLPGAVFKSFDIASGATVDLGEVTIEKLIPIRVAIVDSAGRGLGGAQIEFFDATECTIVGSSICTRADGTLDVGLPHRAVRALVRRHGFATTSVAMVADLPQPLRVALTAAGRVRVVRTAPCCDPGNEHVEARLPGSAWTWRPREVIADRFAPIDEALYVLEDLPAGPVELSLVSRLRTRTKTIDVVAGQTVDCEFSE